MNLHQLIQRHIIVKIIEKYQIIYWSHLDLFILNCRMPQASWIFQWRLNRHLQLSVGIELYEGSVRLNGQITTRLFIEILTERISMTIQLSLILRK